MAKPESNYICQACGAVHPRWSGQCPACGAWDTITEEAGGGGFTKIKKGGGKGKKITLEPLSGEMDHTPRHATGIAEMDRVLGGGLVKGSAILIGGDPGIGKSTLLLQVAAIVAGQRAECLYITGEESVNQVRLRADRLGLKQANVQIAAATSVTEILAALGTAEQAGLKLVVIDSIQTMYVEAVESVPGTVTQVRTAAHELIARAKQSGMVLVLVGHVTKEGQIAGPKVLEHMVDTVLYFEGERGHPFRIVRAVKNRFGAANEIGVFEMTELGLKEVPNPSALFLAERELQLPGSAVFAGIEGTRPVLLEIQALISPSYMSMPRRAVVGWDAGRLSMLLAVLQTRAGLMFGDKEVYLNVAGGLRINEPAADLAVAAALISALLDRPVPEGAVFFGEIGLAGEVRQVSHALSRLRESAKLGFTRAIAPPVAGNLPNNRFILREIRSIRQLNSIFDV